MVHGQRAMGRGAEQRRGCLGGEEGADSGPGVSVGEAGEKELAGGLGLPGTARARTS